MDWCEKNLRGRTKVRQKESEKMSEAIKIEDKKATLLDLANRANEITQLIIEADGELTPELEQALAVSEKDIAQKADGYYLMMVTMSNRVKELKELSKQFTDAAKSIDNQLKSLNERLKFAMESMDTDEIKGERYRFKLSTGKASLVIKHELIGDAFKREVVTTEVDKDLIESKLKAGEKVPGAYLEPTLTLRKYVNK